MTKAAIKKKLKRNKFDRALNMLKVADKLKIKYELVHIRPKNKFKNQETFYFKLSKNKKHFYITNGSLPRNIDKIAAANVGNKVFVKDVLDSKGIKTPQGITVIIFTEAKEALKKKKISFPLVLKPGAAAWGRGVFPNLQNIKNLKKAFAKAQGIKHKRSTDPIILEEYFSGRDYRLLVYKGKLISAIERIRPQVEGDGHSTIKELISQEFKHEGHFSFKIDWEVKRNLKKQKVSLRTVLPEGEVVLLRENANTSTGGHSVNCTKKVCSRFKKIAEEAAKEFNIQICGVDIISPDISNPRSDYRILELNERPAYYNGHENLKKGPNDPVTEIILRDMFKIK